jgi:tetratricopeptide (TPR) repeat protein
LSQVQPVLVLIEDLHWQDEASLELLRTLAVGIQKHRVLLLVTARPEFDEGSIDTGSWTRIDLEHLDRAQARELIRAMGRDRELPPQTVDDIIDRADGVPLYLEELTRAVLEKESGGAHTAIPGMLQDSLMARLDHIPAPKEVAQTASVIGRQFHYELLLSVSEMDEDLLQQSLDQLVEAQVLVQLGAPPKASYLFRQTLIRDTAYQSMVRGTRERRHARVAEIMVERMPEVADRQPELIADHYAEAGNTRKAIQYLKLAGERARERNALDEALRHLNRALDLLTFVFDPGERKRQELGIRLSMGAVLALLKGHAHHETGEVYAEAENLAREAEDDFARGQAALAIGEHHSAQGLLHAAMEHFTECLELGRAGENELLTIGALQAMGQNHFLLGELEEADRVLREAIELHDPERHDFAAAGFPVDAGQSALCWGQWVSFELGDVERAYELSARSLEISENIGRPVNHCIALCWSSMTAIHCGRGSRAIDLAVQAERLATQMGFAFYQELARVLQTLSSGLFANDYADVQPCFEAITRMVDGGHQVCVPWMLDRLAAIHIRAGYMNAAESSLRMAEEIAGRTCQFFRNAEVARLWGEVYRITQHRTEEDIESAFVRALETAREQKSRFLEVQAANSLSSFMMERERRNEARELLEKTLRGFSDTIDTPELLTARSLIREIAGTPTR